MKSHGRQAAVETTFAGTGRLSSVERPVTSAVAYLLACTSLGDSPSEVVECLRSLAKACDFVDEQALVAAQTMKLVEGICEVRKSRVSIVDLQIKDVPPQAEAKHIIICMVSTSMASSSSLSLSPPVPSLTRADREGVSDRSCVEPYLRLTAHVRSYPFGVPPSTRDIPGCSAASNLLE